MKGAITRTLQERLESADCVYTCRYLDDPRKQNEVEMMAFCVLHLEGPRLEELKSNRKETMTVMGLQDPYLQFSSRPSLYYYEVRLHVELRFDMYGCLFKRDLTPNHVHT